MAKDAAATAAPGPAAAFDSTALSKLWSDSPMWPAAQLWTSAMDYFVDAAQRTTLYWDVMRQRGNQYFAHQAEIVPNVLSFKFEVVINGMRLPRPVNYGLVRVIPKGGVEVDETKRPFVIVDPRAGHGPGIGGFKPDSEIGVAMRAGHPCYFVGFAPDPAPGQTLLDVLYGIGTFMEKVNELHADADGKPTVVGNCQAGWAIMMVAAMRPELFGPIIVAGSPMSYWAGVHGANPMRYTGGMVGGSWMAQLMSDLGNGIFDGSWLVQNFENLNPANTLWTKQYNLYSKIDTEGPRYLEFEKWWGGKTLLNGEEIRFIVDELFVGNKLSTAQIITDDGKRIDLRAINGPIIVFCSQGDNITPPQQALGWILDLYKDVDDIRVHGQTIVYTVHPTIGHLGIFVSGGIAKKEHSEFASNIDLIDVLPPGLYEAKFTEKAAAGANGEHDGEYIATFLPRTLDDIRALGGNTLEDERRFATVARLSEMNGAVYRRLVSPIVRACTNDAIAEASRKLHPLRLQYEVFSDHNPIMAPIIAQAAEQVRANRRPVAKDNPFLAVEKAMSGQIEKALDAYRDVRDRLTENLFLATYSAPWLQTLAGLDASDRPPRPRPGDSADHVAFVQDRIAELKADMTAGTPRDAAIRALIYCGMADATFDERGFAALKHIRKEHGDNYSLAEFKQRVREQYYMLLLDEERAVAAIPGLISGNSELAGQLLPMLRRVLTARGPMTPERETRLARIATLMNGESAPTPQRKPRSVA
jgi:pimeloyl-ACP methyl ester carboxylesterase